jgi:hypothetical protein
LLPRCLLTTVHGGRDLEARLRGEGALGPGEASPLRRPGRAQQVRKYAPREGTSPIKETLLDVAERDRSLGIILIGAEQTASEVERRITANSAIRVVGRLDTAEASRDELVSTRTSSTERPASRKMTGRPYGEKCRREAWILSWMWE